MAKRIYVGNLPWAYSSTDLEALFKEYGDVAAAEVIMDRETGRSRGFGFVQMANDGDMGAAIDGLNGQDCGGRPLVVNEAREAHRGKVAAVVVVDTAAVVVVVAMAVVVVAMAAAEEAVEAVRVAAAMAAAEVVAAMVAVAAVGMAIAIAAHGGTKPTLAAPGTAQGPFPTKTNAPRRVAERARWRLCRGVLRSIRRSPLPMSLPPRPEFEPVSADEAISKPQSRVLPWLRLMRLPNVFTAVADVTMGYLFVHRSVPSISELACVISASAALYTAGMVLNDVFDLKVDAMERPFRPLPSGKISLQSAIALGWILLAIGVSLGWLVGLLPGGVAELPWRSGVLASLLAACIVAYDGFLKQTLVGPVAMGACRFLNVLLGMSTGQTAAESIVFGFGASELLAAGGIGTYIVGVTWFARSEAGQSRGAILAAAMVVMAVGVGLLGASALCTRLGIERQIFWLLLALLMFTVLRRGGVAAVDPSPQKVQAAVKHSILSLIWLDAATAVAVAGPAYGVTIALLLIPALVLGRWVYST